MSADTVAIWDVTLHEGSYVIEFQHGTTTGKRVILVNGKEILRRDWLFKLVGREEFVLGKSAHCCIAIDAMGTFAYEYSLEVNGKSYQKFSENQSKLLQTWVLNLDGVPTRVCLEKDTLDVYVNGKRMDTAGEFVDDGTETHFEMGSHVCYLKSASSGRRKKGLVHSLHVDDQEVPGEDN